MTAYESLKKHFELVAGLRNATGLLQHDAELFMPTGSMEDRAHQVEALGTVSHRMMTAPEVAGWLDAAEKDAASLPPADRRNLQLMRRAWVQATALPEEMAAQRALLETKGNEAHIKFRKGEAGWGDVRPFYTEAFDLARTAGEMTKDALGVKTPYDASLAYWNSDIDDADVTKAFDVLEKELTGLIQKAVAQQKKKPAPLPLKGPFPRAQQKELMKRLAGAMGFDFARGRIDVTAGHPASNGTPDDARFTLNIDENDFLSQMVFCVTHEAGHALYDQNLPAAWRHQPVGAAMGMNIHEMCSRIMELHICRSLEFFQYLEKEARDVFNRPDDPALDAKNLQALAYRVQPSLVRLDADEVTYAAHIVLRHRIERDVINNGMSVDDIPAAWNKGMKELLGITPASAQEGCGQDGHWPTYGIGYFPSYTLGDMGAAQVYAAALKAKPEIPSEIAKGNFKPALDWMTDNIYSKGSLLTTDELFTQATGEKLNLKYFLEHLRKRYLGMPPATAAPHPAP